MRSCRWFLVLSVFLSCHQAKTPVGNSPHVLGDDLRILNSLDQSGMYAAGSEVVIRYPAGELADDEAADLVKRLDFSVASLKKITEKSDWLYGDDRRVYFYLADEDLIAHSPPGSVVFMSLARIRKGFVPWIHEAAHIVLAPENGGGVPDDAEAEKMPLWLIEGLAEAMAIEVAADTKIPYYSALWDVPPTKIDGLCKQALDGPSASRLLSFVGAPGTMPELFGPGRNTVARPFYACSTSFVRYIANRFGLAPLLRAIARFKEETAILEQQTGAPLSETKAAWLSGLQALPSPSL